MRWTRPLLLLAMLVIAGGVGVTLYSRFKEQNASGTHKPAALPDGINSSAEGWEYTKYEGQRPVIYVHAKDYRDVNGQFELTGVELHLFQKQGKEYDLVNSAKASFDKDKGLLFSEGDVEIVMNVPKDQEPTGKLMHIRSSGVTFESKTGKASTDRPASFGFDRGEGKATGADYDPETHELHLKHDAFLTWRGAKKNGVPMKVEAGEVIYKERESKVYLNGWSKLTRDTLTLNAGPAVVTLVKGVIKEVDTEHAQGTDVRPQRTIDYAADKLDMNFDDDGQITKIVGQQNARLVSKAETTSTTITSDRLDLDFDTSSGESVLQTALATGHSTAEARPVVKAGSEPADTRILRSDVIKTVMRADGKQIDSVETASAGSLEFVPNRSAQPHRWMNGDRFWIKYGDKNQIESLKSVNVATRTIKPRQKDAKQDPPPALTWSKELRAEFDTKTNQLAKLEQWDEFRYEEGLRKAKADRALLEQAQNLIHLTGSARVWDDTGSTDGDRILLNQKSGDFTADGNVNSTRMPDKKKEAEDSGSGGGMLSQDEPMHAKAKKMISSDNHLLVRYEGDAVAWQGANRLQADVIEIDRDNDVLKAHGHVVSQLLDKGDEDKSSPGATQPKSAKASPVFTIVKAPELVYQDDDRLATYTGGVVLNRPNMTVKSQELRAYLRDDEDDSSLDHAFADGNVVVVQRGLDRTRTGTSDHAEYYVDEAKVILEKGQPQLVDSIKGSTKGRKLTWFSDDDRLLVDGAEDQPSKSMLLRKRAQAH